VSPGGWLAAGPRAHLADRNELQKSRSDTPQGYDAQRRRAAAQARYLTCWRYGLRDFGVTRQNPNGKF
jgi:hypothetical protein